jgi:hypothetical protein
MELKLQAVAPRTNDGMPFRGLALGKSRKREISKMSTRPSAPLFSPAEMRHAFAIWALEKDAARGRRLHLYYCIRCKQAFSVNDRWGSVAPLDQNGNQIQGAEAAARLATFGAGPCPAFGRLAEAPRLTRKFTPVETFRGRLAALIARAWARIQPFKTSARQFERPSRQQACEESLRRQFRTVPSRQIHGAKENKGKRVGIS